MGLFGGLKLTNKGIALQAKLLAGGTLHYTRMAMGDGTLSGSIESMTALVHSVASLDIAKVTTLSGGKVVVGAKMTNAAIGTGFYWRELGVFAQDPDEGEILYCYGNAGVSADYIPPGTGGSDAVEKYIDVTTLVGNASSVTATIDTSLVFVTINDFTAHRTTAVLDHPDNSVTTAKIASKAVTQAKIGDKAVGAGQIADGAVGSGQLAAGAATDAAFGNRSIDDTVVAASGADSPTRLWSKLANMIKAITGKSNWYTAPVTSIESLNTSKASLASPAFTGTPTAPTAAAGTNSTQLATTAFVTAAAAAKANVASPAFTGNVTISGSSLKVALRELNHSFYITIFAGGESYYLSSNSTTGTGFMSTAYNLDSVLYTGRTAYFEVIMRINGIATGSVGLGSMSSDNGILGSLDSSTLCSTSSTSWVRVRTGAFSSEKLSPYNSATGIETCLGIKTSSSGGTVQVAHARIILN